MTCLCVLTLFAQHKRWATIRHLNTMSQGWLSVQSCSVCGLSEVKAPRKAIGGEQHIGQRVWLGENLIPSISVILRYLFDTPGQQKKNGESLQRDASCGSSGNVTAPAVQAKGLSMKKTGRVDFDKRQPISRQQLHRRWRSKQRFCFAAVNCEPNAILLLLHEEGRLTEKASTRPRTAQQPRMVVASRFTSDFLNYSGYQRRQQHP